MTLLFPIVGIRHFLSEDKMYDLLYNSLPDGKELTLLYDNANPHDRYAIQVWTDVPEGNTSQRQQVGFVASDYAPVIRANYPEANLVYAYVKHPDTSGWDTYFEAEVKVEELILPLLPQRLELTPIANIPLPMVSPDKQMLFADIMAYGKEDLEADKVLDLAKRAEPCFGHGLSGNERAAYILMSAMLELMHAQWTPLSDEIWDMRMDLDGTHRDAFKTPELCAQVMEEEMTALRQSATSFFEQYATALKAGLTTKEQELKAHQQWLMALPDNLYAYINDRPQFASRLYYERFQMEELQAIYLHLLCVEWLKGQKKAAVVDRNFKQHINDFSYWGQYARIATKEQAVEAMRHAIYGGGRYPIADLALAVKKLQKNGIIVEHWDLFTNFVSALNALLETQIKANSLARHFR